MRPDLVPSTLTPSVWAMGQFCANAGPKVCVDLGGGISDITAIKPSTANEYVLIIDCNFELLVRGRPHRPMSRMAQANADALRCPLATSSVDLLIMQGLLTTLSETNLQNRVAEEAARILKLGGMLYISDFLVNEHLKYYAQRYDQDKAGVFSVYDETGSLLYNAKHWRREELIELFSKNFSLHGINERQVNTRSNRTINGIELILLHT